MAQHGTGLELLPLEVIQTIFSYVSAKPHWARKPLDRSVPLKNISLTSHTLRSFVFARLFSQTRVNFTVTSQRLRPSRIIEVRGFWAFIFKFQSQLRFKGLTLSTRVTPRDEQQVTTLGGLSFVEERGFWESGFLVAAIYDYINEAINPTSVLIICQQTSMRRSSKVGGSPVFDEPFSALYLFRGKVRSLRECPRAKDHAIFFYGNKIGPISPSLTIPILAAQPTKTSACTRLLFFNWSRTSTWSLWPKSLPR